MCAIETLFETAIDYERTHQIAIYTLLSRSNLGEHLLGIFDVTKAILEPESQLFDIAVNSSQASTYIELKMWSSLSNSQLKRQTAFLDKTGRLAHHLLLGTSWYEHTSESIATRTNGRSQKIGYYELINALNRVIASPSNSSSVRDLALGYRNAIQKQLAKISSQSNHKVGSRLHYYNAYHELQKNLAGIRTSMYTVNNPGGEVYILNNHSSFKETSVLSVPIDVYFEVVNGTLCIKFCSDASNDKKRDIRKQLRKAIHETLGGSLDVYDSGRLGEYMTACKIDFDFSRMEFIKKSTEVFLQVHESFPKILSIASQN